MMTQHLLEVEDLVVEIRASAGTVPVVDSLSFTLQAGETLAIVGESGCGKSMTALALMGLLPPGTVSISAGRILFGGEDLTRVGEARMRALRGNDISMIFQEPMTSLNPVYTAGEQIAEVLRTHQGLNRRQAWDGAVEMLASVNIPDPARNARSYPFQMSGGQRQRVMIAMALACEPRILIADEPTTALDVTVQAQIFDLLREACAVRNTAIILITHDLGVVAEMATRMIVMYAGRRAETGPVEQVITYPRHPYTRGLAACVPPLGNGSDGPVTDLAEIPGIVPALDELGHDACLFAPRCPISSRKCSHARPPANHFAGGQIADCWHAETS